MLKELRECHYIVIESNSICAAWSPLKRKVCDEEAKEPRPAKKLGEKLHIYDSLFYTKMERSSEEELQSREQANKVRAR